MRKIDNNYTPITAIGDNKVDTFAIYKRKKAATWACVNTQTDIIQYETTNASYIASDVRKRNNSKV